jgi:hypothetical protein
LNILIVAGLLVLLAVVLYRVLRPVIRLVRNFRSTLRDFQTITNPKRPGGAVEKLVKCETCGVWIPESRVLTSGLLSYCSSECLKQSGVNRRRNTAA